MLITANGILNYFENKTDYKLVIAVDDDLVNLYRSFVPKHIRLNKQKFAPHITVIRNELTSKPINWRLYDGQSMFFLYDPIVRNDSTYWWLNVQSQLLHNLRTHYCLGLASSYTMSPDRSANFHITIGNTKCL